MVENNPKLSMDDLIKLSIKTCLDKNPKYHKTETLVIVTYNSLVSLYIKNKPYVLLSAPTGTGKSIIGQMIHFCSCFIDLYLQDNKTINNANGLANNPIHSYFLTSSKVLQNQLEEDFARFNLYDYFSILKGTNNYECIDGTKVYKSKTMYPERTCLGMSMEQKSALHCYDQCGYIQARATSSGSDCSVLNYSYFLSALKMKMNPYFGVRPLTIADEAHLLPDIILDHFNLTLSQFEVNKIHKIYEQIKINFYKSSSKELELGIPILERCFYFFSLETINIENIKEYLKNFSELLLWLNQTKNAQSSNVVFQEMFHKEITKIVEESKNLDYNEYLESLNQRPEDLFIQSEFVSTFSFNGKTQKIHKHIVNDMNEGEMCRKHFLSKISKGIFMSATLGNIDEFALLMGMKKEEYDGYRLASNFNFESSPINLVQSGYLNYASFNQNIPKVISDTIKICENIHPNEKGIIHTSTFIIQQKLQQEVCFLPTHKRYLFYQNAEEKNIAIDKMKNDNSLPYIIIGPSLYEGIDLKDDMARFNIIMKAPYSALSDYVKKKIVRFPFYYERNTLEKLVQAIGRTNRHANDSSTTYLMDTVLNKLILKTQDFIVKRVKYFKL